MSDESYGWRNHQTWNVALWLNNDEYLYTSAVKFMERRKNPRAKNHYMQFIRQHVLVNERTPDNISWTGSRLDYEALDEMMRELVD